MKNKTTGTIWKISDIKKDGENFYFRLNVQITKDYEKRFCFVEAYTSDHRKEIHVEKMTMYSLAWQVAILSDLLMIEKQIYKEVINRAYKELSGINMEQCNIKKSDVWFGKFENSAYTICELNNQALENGMAYFVYGNGFVYQTAKHELSAKDYTGFTVKDLIGE